VISTSEKFIFVHIPKTAGNTISLALDPYCEDELTFNEKQYSYNRSKGALHRFDITNPHAVVNKHSTLSSLKEMWDEKSLGHWEEYFKFSVVRNPWDRLISYYFSPHRGQTEFCKKQFRELILSGKVKPQLEYLTVANNFAMDRVIRFEHLKSDFLTICETLNIQTDLPHVNQSSHSHFSEYYDAALKELVRSTYKEDIDYFEYGFN